MQIVSDFGFNPLCSNTLGIRNRYTIPSPSGINCNPCSGIINQNCCCNCFTLSWPGYTTTGAPGCNVAGQVATTRYLVGPSCDSLHTGDGYRCRFSDTTYPADISFVLTQWLDYSWTLVVTIKQCSGGSTVTLTYSPDSSGISCAHGGTFNLTSTVDTTACSGGNTYPSSITVFYSDSCITPVVNCLSTSLPTTVYLDITSSSLATFGFTYVSGITATVLALDGGGNPSTIKLVDSAPSGNCFRNWFATVTYNNNGGGTGTYNISCSTNYSCLNGGYYVAMMITLRDDNTGLFFTGSLIGNFLSGIQDPTNITITGSITSGAFTLISGPIGTKTYW